MSDSKTITLYPGDIWLPQGTIQAIIKDDEGNEVPKEKKPKECTEHQYVTVTLFRFDTEECKHCGKTRDK